MPSQSPVQTEKLSFSSVLLLLWQMFTRIWSGSTFRPGLILEIRQSGCDSLMCRFQEKRECRKRATGSPHSFWLSIFLGPAVPVGCSACETAVNLPRQALPGVQRGSLGCMWQPSRRRPYSPGFACSSKEQSKRRRNCSVDVPCFFVCHWLPELFDGF